MNTQPTMYILVGLPASGKSTWVESNLKKGVVIVSSDKYLDLWAEEAGKTYSDIFKERANEASANALRDFSLAVRKQQTLAIDRTNMTVKGRQNFLKQVSKSGHRKVAVVFDIPEEIRAERDRKRAENTGKFIPPAVINSMRDSYTLPSLDEGFDEIITVKE